MTRRRRLPMTILLIAAATATQALLSPRPVHGAEQQVRPAAYTFNRETIKHPLGFERGPAGSFTPFILVRGGLKARLSRPVYYELVSLAADNPAGQGQGVWSGGTFFPFPAEAS